MTLMLDMARHSSSAYHFATVTNERHGIEVLVFDSGEAVTAAFRGTEFNYEDILRDIRFMPWYARELGCWAHAGFLKGVRSIYDDLLGYVKVGKPIYVTGHSKGGAEAEIFAAMLIKKAGVVPAGLITFGKPRAGGSGLNAITKVIPGQRYVYGIDIVPTVPVRGMILRYRHDRIADRRTRGTGHPFHDHRMANYLQWAESA